jgi:hypothetical protein
LQSGRFEFELHVEREPVITATELESEGIDFEDIPVSWISALEIYAIGYIKSDSKSGALKYVKYHYNIE